LLRRALRASAEGKMTWIDEVQAAVRRWRHVRRFGTDPAPNRATFRDALETLLDAEPMLDYALVELEAGRLPWTDSGIEVEAGQELTLLACGRVYLSRALDVWGGPQYHLWAAALHPLCRFERALQVDAASEYFRQDFDETKMNESPFERPA